MKPAAAANSQSLPAQEEMVMEPQQASAAILRSLPVLVVTPTTHQATAVC
jgi:hypothetical protein